MITYKPSVDSTQGMRDAAPPSPAAHTRAYDTLKDAVLAGHFRPGELVTLRSLALRFSMGEMPVREALRRLTSEGAFEALPNRSARVPRLNRRQVEQILELRGCLEGKAAALTARNITLDQIEHLRALNRDMLLGISAEDWHKHTALNRAFHFEIYRIADNPALIPLIQMLWLRMAPLALNTAELLTGQSAAVRRRAGEHHESLLKAFQARDSAGAESAMQHDLLGPAKIPGYWQNLELTAD